MNLQAEEKQEMLGLVRRYLGSRFERNEKPLLPDRAIYREKSGLFVTLHERGELRGCIGYIEGREALGQALFSMADASAFSDPRFSPLTAEEFDEISIEISILTPLQPISRWQDIVIGKHGILMRKGGRQAVFLPQVAPEQGWDLESTLKHLCRKAGLDSKAYLARDSEFFVFTAEVFSE